MLFFVMLTVAGLLAGALNAVAGGGTFLTFPALVWLGLPPIAANATSTIGALPGYASSAWGYRSELSAEGALGLRAIIALGALGGLIGAGLLLVTPGAVFDGLVPWLLLLATLLFAAGPRILAFVRARGLGPAGPALSGAAVLAVSIYGGYFNGGLGILLLAMLGLIGFVNLHGMNGIKVLLSAVLSLVSAAAYAAAGLIEWDAALIVAVATTIGGYLGARGARLIRMEHLRIGITGVGLVMTALFFAL
ncbi:sulfite exporter TauE/SafE family protein [Limimaricola litoreus]|uniref:Probable membrane transporter protein n=1 Tax=Limimaricola litoreus TaxID=2955316 RepID=A0A9X2G0B8_9RHOB|nr:sulfite exporter TauE/SafE family protein [Limimaricola litoreus]MCP1170403.1 sulfite exporter TauE/SafE family protein [Limimaricola litoreus]